LLYDGWGWWTAEAGVGDEYLGYAVERRKIDIAVGTLFAFVILTERKCVGWSSDGQVDWMEACVDTSLHAWVDLGCHHLGRIGVSMLVRVWFLAAAALCHSVGWIPRTANVSREDASWERENICTVQEVTFELEKPAGLISESLQSPVD